MAILGIAATTNSCSTTHYKNAADKEAYKIIEQGTPKVPGMPGEFSIDEASPFDLEHLPVFEETVSFLGEAAANEAGAHVISLEQALSLAVLHNREYQNQKEALYLAALSLTLERHRYDPIFSGSVSGSYVRTTVDSSEVRPLGEAINSGPGLARQVELLAGSPGGLLSSYADLVKAAGDLAGLTQAENTIVDERSVTGDAAIGVSMLLKGGATIAAGITSNFLRFLTGDPRADASSALFADITQPLLRGAGKKVAAERLIQAERDLLYQLRTFARYRQEFTVQIASRYYSVLQLRDTANNNWQSLQRFHVNVERERAFAAEGKRTQSELGRLEQALLTNENTWIGSVRNYKQRLDEFKIDLGLSTDTKVILDDQELVQLKERGIMHPTITPEDASKVALAARLDLYTQQDKVDDAQRKVVVAANALKPRLDLVAGADVLSTPGNQFLKADFDRAAWSAGVDVELPFDRKPERNVYRSALIANERAKRDLTLAEDGIKLDVREAWRTLDQAKRSYEIAAKSLELNIRRVEEQNLLAELGRATALNQVDAQNDLNTAENALTNALVSHTVARLEFWRDMGILFIKENGQWEDVKDDQPESQAQ